VHLVRATVSLALLAKLLGANLLRDSLRQAPRRTFLGAGITPAIGLGSFRLALGLLLLSIPLVHDSFNVLQVRGIAQTSPQTNVSWGWDYPRRRA
jgi:hypothetical protein